MLGAICLNQTLEHILLFAGIGQMKTFVSCALDVLQLECVLFSLV